MGSGQHTSQWTLCWSIQILFSTGGRKTHKISQVGQSIGYEQWGLTDVYTEKGIALVENLNQYFKVMSMHISIPREQQCISSSDALAPLANYQLFKNSKQWTFKGIIYIGIPKNGDNGTSAYFCGHYIENYSNVSNTWFAAYNKNGLITILARPLMENAKTTYGWAIHHISNCQKQHSCQG